MMFPIVKEIETEHKVFKEYNMRQVISMIATAIVFVVFYIIFYSLTVAIGFTVPFAGLFLLLSKSSSTGLSAEETIMKNAKEHYYHNSSRKYRTKNKYAIMMNSSYKKLRNADCGDKAVLKQMKKDKKNKERKIKKSKVKAII